MTSPFDALPQYRSHKIVRASPITCIEYIQHENPLIGDMMRITVADGVATVQPSAFYARYVPKLGDFLVVYYGGFVSVSPKAQFDAGYTRL